MLTTQKNLRTGQTIWSCYRSPRIPSHKLLSEAATDIVVIGAGISGAMVAEELTDAGFKIILLDKRGPLKGSTSATTALLQYEIDVPLTKLQKKIGLHKARRAWKRARMALDSLEAKIHALAIDCDIRRQPSLYLAGNLLDSDALKKEMQARNAVGLYTQFLTRKALLAAHGIRRAAALKTWGSLSVNPEQLAAGFLKRAIRNGAKIFAPVEAYDIEHHGNAVSVITSQGHVIKAKHVIFTTGYEMLKCLKNAPHHSIHSTWAIATKKQPAQLWPEKCLIWEASDPYLYVRTTSDGRVICGGEDEEFSNAEERDTLISRKTLKLEKKLSKLFPKLDSSAEFAWTGSFGSSNTGLPSIGPVPGMKQCYSVMAFGGNGIIYSRIAAEILRSQLTGNKDPDTDLFAFQ